MSEKVKELMEIPQEFLRDGNQVCVYSVHFSTRLSVMTVLGAVHKTVSERCLETFRPFRGLVQQIHLSPRIRPNLQGRCYWIRCHGFHWILREAYSHSDVSAHHCLP